VEPGDPYRAAFAGEQRKYPLTDEESISAHINAAKDL
jgi:hypothetical protein